MHQHALEGRDVYLEGPLTDGVTTSVSLSFGVTKGVQAADSRADAGCG